MPARIRWLGAAGLEIESDGFSYLVDPYYTRERRLSILLGWPRSRRDVVERGLASLGGVLRAVVVGHTHADHALDAPTIARLTEARFIGSESLANLMLAYGLAERVVVCKGGETIELGPRVKVHMLPSAHGKVFLGRTPFPGEIPPGLQPPLHAWQYRHGKVFLPIFELGRLLIAHVGSANLDESAARWERPVDLAFVCVPGWKGVPDFLSRLWAVLRPKKVVPFHYDDFTKRIQPGQPPPLAPGVDLGDFLEALFHAMPSVVIELVRPYQWLEVER